MNINVDKLVKVSSRCCSVYLRWIVGAVVAVIVSGCASTPEIKPVVHGVRPAQSNVVDYALSLEGAPYRYGKSSPEEGFDCSGFVQHVYKRYGKSLPRTAHNMAMALPSISKSELASGDLVFFNTNGRRYSHVGIYIDDDEFIHASSSRTGKVVISDMASNYWQRHFTGARRP